jgi:hypothetical protein
MLEDMRARGHKVFSIATVGRECEARKLLSTQYIRNANGEPFRRLIDAFSRQHGLATGREPTRRQTPLQEAVATISDLDIRTRLLSLIDDNKALRAQVLRLEAGFKRMTVPTFPSSSDAAPSIASPEVEILPHKGRVSLNLGPLERFVSIDWIDQKAWTVTGTGTIMDGPHPITPPGFVPAMKAALESLREIKPMTGPAATPSQNAKQAMVSPEAEKFA